MLNTLRLRQNGRHFADDIFTFILLNENVWISTNIPLKFVPKGQINNILALVQIMAWRRPGDKPLSEPMVVSLLTHICVTRPQWINNPSNAPFLTEYKSVAISWLGYKTVSRQYCMSGVVWDKEALSRVMPLQVRTHLLWTDFSF